MTEPIVGVMPSLEDCQEFLSYMPDKGVFTPTRVPQGSSDAAIHFQSTVETVLGDLGNNCVIVWIDDLLVFADTQKKLLDAIEAVLNRLDEHGLILNLKQSAMFLMEVHWFGRIINKQGIGHDPARTSALRDMPVPPTAAELQQFLCASNWMRAGLVDYARVARPIQERHDTALAGTKITNRVATCIYIVLTPEERRAFEAVKELLGNSAMMAYPDPNKQLCVLSDASGRGWGLVVSQITEWQPDVPIQEQEHELLVCMGGSFTGLALNWSVIEKESYPIVHACEKLEYPLLRPQGFRLYCDHRNIIFLFSPSKKLKRHIRGKLLRWSTKLLEYRYSIEHIEGVHNVWAALISRWGGKPQPTARIHSAKRFTQSKRKHSESVAGTGRPTIRPLEEDAFVWPSIDEIGSIQPMHVAPQGAALDSNNLWKINDLIWIPSEANELIERLLIIAHCGRNGHRRMHIMTNPIHRLFSIGGIFRIVRDFCRKRLLWLHVKGGVVIPRSFSETHHTNERNATLHRDFLTLCESFGSSRYALVLKDEAIHFVQLVARDDPTSQVAATTILDWYSRFGPPSVWVSDSGSHFKANVTAELCRRLKGRHEFILAYSPWEKWTNRATRYHHHTQINFSVGDYVLRSRVDEKRHGNKLRVMWVGPYRVIGSSDYYFTVEHLVNGTTMDVHPSRLKFYAVDSLNVNEETIDHIASQGTMMTVEEIVGHRMNHDMQAYEVKVRWLGLEAIEDSWEPIKSMSEDVPKLCLQYANEASDDDLLLAVTSLVNGKA
ncbi:unnamed protein product [Phytophthora fragariaefolia]|uniref:Unnamed protein product n=1 Tax=Phytophthora fragariaefolia TaxID=1490495 RepID=A0A9W6TPM9_9STRA|nr:unnamed protein product [Phytophthora fragariaefolia]